MRFIAYSFGGNLVGAAKTNSTARNQLIDGTTDNRAIKDAVGDSLTDNNTSKKALNSFDDRGYKPKEENSKDLVQKNMQDYLHMSINPLEMKHLMVIFTEVLVVKHLMVALLLQLKKM